MVEIRETTHREYHYQLHGLRGSGDSFRNDGVLSKQYKNFRSAYWKWRAAQEGVFMEDRRYWDYLKPNIEFWMLPYIGRSVNDKYKELFNKGVYYPCDDRENYPEYSEDEIIKIEVIGCRDFIKIYESADIKFFHDRLQRKVSEILLRRNSRDLLNFFFCFPFGIHTLYFSFVVSDGIVDTVTYELGNRAKRFETAVLRAFGIRRIEGFIDGKISVVKF